jgi:RNA polymerase sigma-70 factor (ECF subfamily)
MNTQVPDSELIAAVKAGDTGAFEELFRRNQRRVYSVALTFFGGRTQSAEDITQQVFLKFYTNLKRFRGDARVSTWLYRITINLCIDEQKRRKRFSFFGDLFDRDEEVPLPDASRGPDRLELQDEVRKAVGELKPVFRVPLVLKHVEGMSYTEMAEVMDCSEGTVASRLSRGHKLLAEKLKHLRG